MKTRSIIGALAVAFSSISMAAGINFSGTLGVIEMDTGTATFSGAAIGDHFSGRIIYGDSAADASSVDNSYLPTGIDFIFAGPPYGGSITGGAITIVGTHSSAGIGNDDVNGDDAMYINHLYGAGSIAASTITDAWDAEGFNSFQEFGVTLYSLDTSLYSGLDLQVFPPRLDQSDFALFYIQENDAFGNTVYLASGKLTSISPVPAPAALWQWLFGAGLIGLIGLGNRRMII